MVWRWFLFLAAFSLVLLPTQAPSAEKASGPTLTIRVQAIDTLLTNLKQLATLAGKAEEAKQIDGFVRSRISDNSLDGIDVKRPLGFYSTLTTDLMNSPTIAMVPIASQKDLLELLKNFNLPATKGKDGIYTITPEKVPVSFHVRFANDYGYVTAPEKGALKANNLIAPADFFPQGAASTFALAFYMSQLPDELKQIALSQLDLRFTNLQEQKVPNETPAQAKLRAETLKEVARQAAAVVNEGQRFGLVVDLNPDKEVRISSSLSAKADSKLAENIAALAKKPNRFAALAAPGAALTLTTNLTLPAEIRKALGPVIDEGIQKSVAEEENEAKKKAGAKFLEALKPTLKAGTFETGLRVAGPTDRLQFTLSFGVRVKDGAKLLAAFRDMAKTFPETERAILRFDVAKAGGVAIHQIDGKKYYEDEIKRVLGEGPLFFAFAEDAVMLTGGPGALEAMKELIAVESAPAPLFQLDMSMSRLAPTVGKGSDVDHKAIVKAASATFRSPGSDQVRFSVTGGKTLLARFTMQPAVVKFLAEVDKVNRKVEAKEKE